MRSYIFQEDHSVSTSVPIQTDFHPETSQRKTEWRPTWQLFRSWQTCQVNLKCRCTQPYIVGSQPATCEHRINTHILHLTPPQTFCRQRDISIRKPSVFFTVNVNLNSSWKQKSLELFQSVAQCIISQLIFCFCVLIWIWNSSPIISMYSGSLDFSLKNSFSYIIHNNLPHQTSNRT